MARGEWEPSQIPPQHGRVAVVTGANSGLGFVTARELALRGARVVMGCRDPARGAAARTQIAADVPGADLVLEALDLADLSSVADFARRQLARDARLDLLVANAGIMGVPEGRTRDGFELQFGTNHLGHFALAAQLHGAIARTPGSRVVTVTSLGYRIGRIDFDDLEMRRGYDAPTAAASSRTCSSPTSTSGDSQRRNRLRSAPPPTRAMRRPTCSGSRRARSRSTPTTRSSPSRTTRSRRAPSRARARSSTRRPRPASRRAASTDRGAGSACAALRRCSDRRGSRKTARSRSACGLGRSSWSGSRSESDRNPTGLSGRALLHVPFGRVVRVES